MGGADLRSCFPSDGMHKMPRTMVLDRASWRVALQHQPLRVAEKASPYSNFFRNAAVFTDKDKEWVTELHRRSLPVTPWLGWEGCGMDVVIRMIDQEEELAEFLFECEAFFEEDDG